MLAMEDSTFCFSKRTIWIASFVKAAAAVETLLAFQSLAWLLLVAGSLLLNINDSHSPKLSRMDGSFSLEELLRGKHAYLENKDASETDEDDDEEDEDANDQDDDGEEEFSGEEGEEEADPEDDPEANGAGGSDDEDDDGEEDDDEDGEDEDDEEEEEEEDDDDEVPQPPAKKRK